jgi:hypothetical protein
MCHIQINGDKENDSVVDFLIRNIYATLLSDNNFITKAILITFTLFIFLFLVFVCLIFDVLKIAVQIGIVFCALYFIAWLIGYDLIEIISSFI